MQMSAKSKTIWTFVITSVALFMGSLDNLVVTTALPVIRVQLHASLSSLEWTINAYTLSFAVMLLTGAALGERYGRRRVFLIGIAVFTVGSMAAALAPSVSMLVAARMVQGLGAAVMTPLTLTLLSAAVSPERRGLALGAWGAIGGLAIALGPVVGGAVVQGISWHWIFWLNVPIGAVLVPLGYFRLERDQGRAHRLDLRGLVLVSAGLFAVVFGLIRGNEVGWSSEEVLVSLGSGALLLAAFVRAELSSDAPMLPMRLFRSRGFAATNLASFFMFFGMFGSIFLLAQFFQTAQHYTPLQAGLRILPWTAMPILIAPIAGAVSDRIGGRRVVALGVALQATGLAWVAEVAHVSTSYIHFVPAFIVNGIGMSLFFAPVANLVLSSVRRDEEGIASGATNAIRELGGVFGVAVLAGVFSAHGGYQSAAAFVSGLRPAVFVGSAVVVLGAIAMLFVPPRAESALPTITSEGEADDVVQELVSA
jgi:EmrB/QacA subfamily drug resistance transporter